MFSSFFGTKKKTKTSPDDESPKHEDGYEIVEGGGGFYPALPEGGSPVPRPRSCPYPAVPAQPAQPTSPVKDASFLQGVPFDLSKELSAATTGDRDAIAMQLNEILAFISLKMNIRSRDYDFRLEKSVLRES